MKFRVAIGAAIASAMMVSAAAAASLSIIGGANEILGSGTDPHDPNYNDPSIAPAVTDGDTVLAFGSGFADFDGTNGLKLSHDATIQVTFLGKEANATNVAMNYGTGSITNNDAAGSFFRTKDDPDWVELIFMTNTSSGTASIENNVAGQGDYSGLSMAFFQEDSKNVIGFFGDGRGDTDFDDMVVRISIVPLLAGGVLLLTALGGFAVARRKKKAA